MIPNILKYDDTTDSNEDIDTYEWIMMSLRMEKQFTCVYFPVTV